MQFNTIYQTLKLAQTKLIADLTLASVEAKLEAQILLLQVLDKNRAWLIAHEHDLIQPNMDAAFQALLNRRLDGEPIAYIVGFREFYGLHLQVTPDTLVPRPDTETLVEAALAKIPTDISQPNPAQQPYSILDLGTGSGAIALAIAKNRPIIHMTAIDASPSALKVAIENAQYLTLKNVQFLLSNWFGALQDKKFDLIVSNPPYIEANDAHLTQGDLRFEPMHALAAGADGLADIRTIINDAPRHLKAGGWLMLEHGYNQAQAVAALLQMAGFTEINHALDLSGIQRVTLGRFYPPATSTHA